ncbi:MAG: hypothetical protein LBS07_05785, partial [Prevotellaceae bacterium]|nr:hypothetical protein [Prevotellaceae bacterium]
MKKVEKRFQKKNYFIPLLLILFLSTSCEFLSPREDDDDDVIGNDAKIELSVTNITSSSVDYEVNILTDNIIYVKGIRYTSDDGSFKEIFLDGEEKTLTGTIEKLTPLTVYSIIAFADIDGNEELVKSEEVKVTTSESAGYQLVFSDEFDVNGKPATHWTYENGYVRNNEAQYYTDN